MPPFKWVIRVSSNEHELGMTYSVMVYLGAVPNPADGWPWGRENCIVEHVSYTSEETVPPERDIRINTGATLNPVLTKTLGLREDELTPEVVVPYLRENVQWRIRKMDTSVVDPKDLPSLKVTLYGGVKDDSEEGKRPTQFTEYPL